MKKILHILSQRPSLTGSGITLDAMVRHAARKHWDQYAIVGVPTDDPDPQVGALDRERIRPLRFGPGHAVADASLEFAVPGMSDVMPYASTRFRDMSPAQIQAYRTAWQEHIRSTLAAFQPDVVHTHHVWILSS